MKKRMIMILLTLCHEAITEDGKSKKSIFSSPKNLVTKRLSTIHRSQQAALLSG